MKSLRKPTKEDKRTIDTEIRLSFAEYDRKNVREIEAITLWALHEIFGFGKKRLRLFYFLFKKKIDELINRYLMTEQDMDWLCTRKLKEIGVDVDEWHKEWEDAA